jgi:hypothetical protein
MVCCVRFCALWGWGNGVRDLRIDSIELALIQLQFALADYYSARDGEALTDLTSLDDALRNLHSRVILAQVTIYHVRTEPEPLLGAASG